MKIQKPLAALLLSLLTFGLAQTAFADVICYDLSKDDLNISETTDNIYEVTGTTTEHSIIIAGGVSAHIVLKGVNIDLSTGNGIDIGSNADVIIELDGDNVIDVSGRYAGINVAEGKLTISNDNGYDGETVKIYEDDLDSGILPSYILENLATKDDITLVIVCDDFDIRIPSEDSIADAGDKRCYTIEELAEIYE